MSFTRVTLSSVTEIHEYDLVTAKDAAAILGVDPSMVTYLVNSGCLLPVIRTPRTLILERRKVEALLEARIRGGYKTPDFGGAYGGRPSSTNGKAPHGD